MGRENLAGVAAILEEALARPIAADAVEIAVDAAAGEVEAIAEEWTLHLEGWPDRPVAWLALDDEPDDPAAVPLILLTILDRPALKALAAADVRLGGALVDALRTAHDPLSAELAEHLAALRPETDPA